MFILRKIFKILGRIISVILILFILIPAVLIAVPYSGNAKDVTPIGDTTIKNTYKENNGKQYPFVLVHGMMGWGENAKQQETTGPYFGLKKENDLPSYLRNQGYEVYVPSVSPVGSAYDRACELYAQLTGTRVDYGEAHAKEYGHERYGRDYTGNSIMGEDAWDLKSKINLVGHSFGGPTIRVLASLLAYGSTAEVEASGDDCSELFKGGYADAINAVVTLASPSNGSPMGNLMYDSPILTFAFTSVMNLMYDEDKAMDPMLDQWGMTDKYDLLNDLKLSRSKDHCGYDMTLNGASVLNKKFPTVDSIYYISYSADIGDTDASSYEAPSGVNVLSPSNWLIKHTKGLIIDGRKITEEWASNDGLVPVVSAQYPDSDSDNHVDVTLSSKMQRGVWNVMPTDMAQSHGYYCSASGDRDNFYKMFTDMFEMVNNLE